MATKHPNGRIPTSDLAALPKSWSSAGRAEYLTRAAYESLSRMIARAVAETGVNFRINDAYRSLDEQVGFLKDYYELYRSGRSYETVRTFGGQRWGQKPGNPRAATPGTSNHGEGVSIDIVPAAIQGWLKDNAGRFGWVNDVPSEPWHWSYLNPGKDQYRSEGVLDHAWVQRVVGAEPDGKIGTGTVAKIRDWQRANGLTADGKVGPDTKRRMAAGGNAPAPSPATPIPTGQYQSRSAWTSAPNDAPAIKQDQVHLTVHYPGFGNASIKTADWEHSRCLSQIAAWEKQHQARESKNVEYNYFACPHGHLIEGRGDRQNAANGTSAANRAGQSVQALIGDDEPLTAGHRQAIQTALIHIDGLHAECIGTQYQHSHWKATACSGPHIRAAMPFRIGPGTPAVSPGAGAGLVDGGDAWRTSPRVQGMTASQVRHVQTLVTELGYELGSHGVDGSYGQATADAVATAQRDRGLTADGIAGPGSNTNRVLEDEVGTINAKIDDINQKLNRVIAFGEQNQWRLDRLPAAILDEPIKLAGSNAGKTSSDRTTTAWTAHNHTQTHQMIAALAVQITAQQKTLEALAAGQGFGPEVLDAVRAAAAEGARDGGVQVSAEDVARLLTIAVDEPVTDEITED